MVELPQTDVLIDHLQAEILEGRQGLQPVLEIALKHLLDFGCLAMPGIVSQCLHLPVQVLNQLLRLLQFLFELVNLILLSYFRLFCLLGTLFQPDCYPLYIPDLLLKLQVLLLFLKLPLVFLHLLFLLH